MKNISTFFLLTLGLIAEENQKHSFVSDLIGSLIPIVVFFVIFLLVIKRMNKNSGVKEAADSNMKLAESNLILAAEIKRIADSLEKKEKE